MANPKGGTLTKNQTTIYKVAEMVASGLGSAEISAEIGVTKKKATEWMRHAEVRAVVTTLLKNNAQTHVAKALKVTFDLLDDPNPWVRMSAARMIIEKQGAFLTAGDADAENVIRIEGLPNLGIPDGTIGAESVMPFSEEEDLDVEATIT